MIDSIDVEEEKERVETSTLSPRTLFDDDRTELSSIVLPLPGGPQRTTGGGSEESAFNMTSPADDDEDEDEVWEEIVDDMKSSSILACLIVSTVGTTRADSNTDDESIISVGTLLAHGAHSPFSIEKSKSKRLWP
jgi:hypothetical protein